VVSVARVADQGDEDEIEAGPDVTDTATE